MDRQEAERIYEAGREAVIAALLAMDARIKEMEQVVARLTRNSSNSSRPPSSDPPGLKKTPKTSKKQGKRRQGGQPGHKGKKRQLLPASSSK